MAKVSKETASGGGAYGPVTDRSEEVNGFTVNFVSFHEDVDATPLMKGLPDDRCQSPHWGYVISGRLTFRFGDREEVYEPGDGYYAPPGHIPVVEAGTEIVEFSPTQAYEETMQVVARNAAAGQE